MKNIIAALYSSGNGGKKSFEKGGVALGWQPIVDQYNRDQHRVALGIGRRVPGLLYSYVERDCWTRLNVLPAKIMQVIIIIFSLFCLNRPSDRVRLKNANYAIFSGQIVRLERPIMR